MIDPKFYNLKRNIKTSYICDFLGLSSEAIIGGDNIIDNIATLSEATSKDLSFCENANDSLLEAQAGIILINNKDYEKFKPKNNVIIVKSPRAFFSRIATHLVTPLYELDYEIGNPILEDSVKIGSNSIIANSASIGKNTRIGHNVIIGPGVSIGRNCLIENGVTINCAFIGDNVRIGANSVIGKSGFGVAVNNGNLIDVPQFGRVIIQDDVTIGALCTIDRGAFDDTIIGLNSKIDNHCHIGHNSKLGQGVVIAAFGGISGSVEIGNYVMMGGRVGIGDHFKIGDGAKLAAGAAVLSDVGAGETFAGYPAKPKIRWMKETIALSKLIEKSKK